MRRLPPAPPPPSHLHCPPLGVPWHCLLLRLSRVAVLAVVLEAAQLDPSLLPPMLQLLPTPLLATLVTAGNTLVWPLVPPAWPAQATMLAVMVLLVLQCNVLHPAIAKALVEAWVPRGGLQAGGWAGLTA